MEFEIELKLKVNIKDLETNVNEIVRAVKEVMRNSGIEVLKELLRAYQLRIRESLLNGEMVFPHDECAGDKGFNGRGWRRRSLKTEVGDIEYSLSRLECKGCGCVISPFLDVIGIVPWQRIQEGLKERLLELLTDLSYRRTERQSFDFTDVFVSKSQLNRWILEDDWSGIVFDVDMEKIKEVFADGTKIKKQDGTKGDLRLLIGKTEDNKMVPIGVWIDKGWGEIGKELKDTYGEEGFRGKVLLSDGEQGIEDHLLFKDMEHQRCLWHGGRDLGYVLWKDGLDKEARDKITEDFKKGINITLRDREEIMERLEGGEKSLRELTETFKRKGLEASATYVENLSKGLFTYVKVLLERGEVISRTTGPIERSIREIGRRIKKVGGSWTDEGALNLIKLLWKRVFEGDNLKRFWRESFGLNGNCQITLVSVSCTI